MFDGVDNDTRPHTSSAFEGGTPVRETSLVQGRKMSMAVSVFNVITTIIGSGILGLPYAASLTGLLIFTVMVVGMGFISQYSLRLVVNSALLAREYSWSSLASYAFGNSVVDYIVIIQASGSVTSYLVVVRDIVDNLLRKYYTAGVVPYTSVVVVTCALTTFLITPLALSRKMQYLGMTSFAAAASIVVFITVVCQKVLSNGLVGSSDEEVITPPPILYPTTFENVLLELPTVCFSFTCHSAILSVFDELREADAIGRTRRCRYRIGSVIQWSVSISVLIYLVAGYAGSLRYGSGTRPDLLVSIGEFEGSDAGVTEALQLLILMSISLHVPLIQHPCRELVEKVSGGQLSLDSASLLMIAVPLFLALAVPQIAPVFVITGAVSSISLIFLVPPLLYSEILRSNPISLVESESPPLLPRTRAPVSGELLSEDYTHWRLFILGIILLICSWWGILSNVFKQF
eukprot:TRINITY_DN33802_c0_g1_i1.p1 TRINITY_DN33802_c0_g1~~TRINITY_DN33802_c0_g1_i1.p1  ORF type:complete len:460 (+),score=67.70 TRINITY_DN33802_c0_g1_i1:27-1406(+)